MNVTQRFLLGTLVIGAALYLGLDALYPRLFPAGYRSGLVFGLAVSLGNVLGSFFLLSWGGRRGDKAFFASFAIGMLGRFALIGVAAWVAYHSAAMDFRATLITLVAAFFPLTGYEVYCLMRSLDSWRAHAATLTGGTAAPVSR